MASQGQGMQMWDVLNREGGVAHVRRLTAAGVPRGLIDAALRSGAVWRPRRGWIAAPDAEADLVAAVGAGARVGCVSAADRHGLWVLERRGLHLAVPRHSGHARPPTSAVVHWRGGSWRSALGTVDDVEGMIADVADCLPTEEAVCIIDSAINRGLINQTAAIRVLAHTARGRWVAARIDGRAESGLETLPRLRLRAVGIPVELQVWIGAYRADLLVAGRLILECDGGHHDAPAELARDRGRDLRMLVSGHEIIRLGSNEILHNWPLALAVIRSRLAS